VRGLHAGEVVEAAPHARADFYPGLRLVRMFAMLSIIGHHILWAPVFGVAFGVTSLQIVMCALQTRQLCARPLVTVVRKRSLRLLVPWVLWSAIYAASEVALAARYGRPLFGAYDSSSWITGGAFHLWFLPFALLTSVVANRAHRASRRFSNGGTILFFAMLGSVLVLCTPILQRELDPVRPFNYWIDSAGTVAFGVAIGRVLSIRDKELRNRWLFTVLVFASLPLILGPHFVQVSPIYERYGVALSLVCAGFVLRMPDSPVLAKIASYNLGVYLVHMLVLRAMDRFPLLDGLTVFPRLALCYLLCLLAVAAIRRARVPHLA